MIFTYKCLSGFSLFNTRHFAVRFIHIHVQLFPFHIAAGVLEFQHRSTAQIKSRK